MATTDVPNYLDEPVHMSGPEIRDLAQSELASAMGDLDKADSTEDAAYYGGRVDVLQELLDAMTQDPDDG